MITMTKFDKIQTSPNLRTPSVTTTNITRSSNTDSSTCSSKGSRNTWNKSSLVAAASNRTMNNLQSKCDAKKWVKPGRLCSIHPDAICYANPNKPLGYHCFQCHLPVLKTQQILGRNHNECTATFAKIRQKQSEWHHIFESLAAKRDAIKVKLSQSPNVSATTTKKEPKLVDGMYIVDKHFSYDDYLTIVMNKK